MQSWAWGGKCFDQNTVTNLNSAALAASSATLREGLVLPGIVATASIGDSLSPSGGKALLLRYASDSDSAAGLLQDVVAGAVTGGYSGTGAAHLSGMLDELRPLAAMPGVWLGLTYTASKDEDGESSNNIALWFAMANH